LSLVGHHHAGQAARQLTTASRLRQPLTMDWHPPFTDIIVPFCWRCFRRAGAA
jgi:hypothetical protein